MAAHLPGLSLEKTSYHFPQGTPTDSHAGDHPLYTAMFKVQDPVALKRFCNHCSLVLTVSDICILSISVQADIYARGVATDITLSCTTWRLLRHQILPLNNHYRPSLQLLWRQLLRRLHLLSLYQTRRH